MADLADKIDDLICSFDGAADTTMDTIAMYLFGWMVFSLFVLAIGKYIYGNFVSAKESKSGSVVTETVISSSLAAEPLIKPSLLIPKEKKASTPAPVSNAPSTGGKYVPPTPPTRKRLGSKSGRNSVPPLARPKSASNLLPPVALGPDSESVKWVNELFLWLYSDFPAVQELLTDWIFSLNEFMKKSVEEHGVGVELVRVLTETHPPNITNVFCECAPNDDITITCDCDATPAMQLKALRQKGEKVEVSHYRVNINKFRARLHILCITEKLTAQVRADGWPEIKIGLAPVGSIKNNKLDESQLQDVVIEILTNAVRSTQLNLNLGQFPNCPRFSRYLPEQPPVLPVHYDSLLLSSKYPQPPPVSKSGDRKLLVKVVKAQNLSLPAGTTDTYCVIEMDEPPQKNQTAIKKETNSPQWDEHFLFEINPRTAELLFEIYSRSKSGTDDKFLGLGIVGMEELLISPAQRQTISLQSRPYQDDKISGTLTVEFNFTEGSEIPLPNAQPYKLKETLNSVSSMGKMTTTTKTVYQSSNHDHLSNGVTESALKDIGMRNRINQQNNTGPSKSTLIIHSVQRQLPPHYIQVKKNEKGEWIELAESDSKIETCSTDSKVEPSGMEPSPSAQVIGQEGKPTVNGSGTDISTAIQQASSPEAERGRTRRRRDFFGTIRRRLNRSKGRSKSVDPGAEQTEESGLSDTGFSRSASADRSRDPSVHSLVPPLQRDGSARSSFSEASGISGASQRTYVNEASTLVLETLENGEKKHYMVPISIAHRGRWRKKGTKLHIFNDHTFVAKHLPSGTICEVCNKFLPRRIGKQGYECRDCGLKCHKQCHVKTDRTCPHSSLHNLELLSTTAFPFLRPRNNKWCR
nr:PREDICTED: uncharacterized protein LOC109032994 isoform X3 [Bemisia tabaci]